MRVYANLDASACVYASVSTRLRAGRPLTASRHWGTGLRNDQGDMDRSGEMGLDLPTGWCLGPPKRLNGPEESLIGPLRAPKDRPGESLLVWLGSRWRGSKSPHDKGAGNSLGQVR